jgi:hypothetical protein
MYTRLEKDAFLDTFPDSDRLGGRTDVKGFEFILDYGLSPNVYLTLDYYRFDRIAAISDQEDLLQTDLNFKF